MKRHVLTISVLVTLLVALGAGVAGASPLARPSGQAGAPTVVSYQGLVTVAGVPHNGKGYFKFAIVGAGGGTTYWSNDGTASGEPVNAVELTVTNGVFTVLLGDSGMNALTADVFDGSERYLRVWFSSDGSTFALLSPDQRIAAVPYALQATNADTLDGAHAAAFWLLGGNADTTAGTHFLGTNDNQALELKVNRARALRLEPNVFSPNVIGGYSGNGVTDGVFGAAIGGGGLSSGANSVTDNYGTVGGGASNQAGDGTGYTIDCTYATVGGGSANAASGSYATVGGGQINRASGDWATVPGGLTNAASGSYATVGGGQNNRANGDWATAPGGKANVANGKNSFAAGTYATAAHDGAFVWGDHTEQPVSSTGANQFIVRASGGVYMDTKAFAAGTRAQAAHDGAFVWGDHTDQDISSTAADQFIVRASGGIWLGTTSLPSTPSGYFLNTSTGAYLTSGGVWGNNSDRNAKENLAPVDVHAVLDRLAAMPVSTWSYKAEDASVRHMGPMAQDFAAAFGLGDSDTSIGTIDADGVALAAIQGLYQRAQDQAARIDQLEAENAALRAQMASIEARLAALEQGR